MFTGEDDEVGGVHENLLEALLYFFRAQFERLLNVTSVGVRHRRS